MNYEQLAKKLVQRAKKQGATQAEAYLEIGRTSSCKVHGGEIEDLTQATSKGVGLRVIHKDRLGFASTSDFDPDRLNAFVDKTLALAEVSAPNKLNGLPRKQDLVLKDVGALEQLFDPEVANLASDWKIKAALEMERAGKAHDPRITAFSGVGAGDYVVDVYVASSEGLSAAYSGTYVYLYAAPVASENGQLQTSDWMDYKRFLRDLDSPEQVGREAARRALRMLGAKKVKSKKVPVIFEPQMAAQFVRSLASAASGDVVFQQSSFLAKKLGKTIGPANVSIVDDGRLEKGLASAPFDGEGVPTRKTPIIEKGVVKNFLYDSFTARKAKTRATGNASRSYNSLPHIGLSNLYIEKGTTPPGELIREVKDGFYVTAMLGHGADLVTGEYSRGANGLWIENGELAFPVQEVTVAGNMLDMVASLDGLGSDLQFRGSTGAPTLRFSELMVAGE